MSERTTPWRNPAWASARGMMLFRLVLGVCLVWASSSKWSGPLVGETLYLKVIGQSLLLHRLFCLVELSLEAWILSGWRPRACASVLAVLFAFFLGAIAIDAFQKTPLPCGCGLLPAGLFRRHPTLVLGAGFFLNLVFMAGTSWLAVAAHEKGSPGPSENTP